MKIFNSKRGDPLWSLTMQQINLRNMCVELCGSPAYTKQGFCMRMKCCVESHNHIVSTSHIYYIKRISNSEVMEDALCSFH